MKDPGFFGWDQCQGLQMGIFQSALLWFWRFFYFLFITPIKSPALWKSGIKLPKFPFKAGYSGSFLTKLHNKNRFDILIKQQLKVSHKYHQIVRIIAERQLWEQSRCLTGQQQLPWKWGKRAEKRFCCACVSFSSKVHHCFSTWTA